MRVYGRVRGIAVKHWAVIGFMMLLALPAQALQVSVQGLFKNTAVLTINGKQHLLKAGQASPEGVLLVSSTPKQAVVEINGQRETLTLSRRISGQFKATDRRKVSIPRNGLNQYVSNAAINGKRVQVIVDTGANIIAMNSQDAQFLGIPYREGVPSIVRTASGEAKSYSVKLRAVDVGGILVSGVEAAVIEGSFPDTILLGMSYLQHVDITEKGGVLNLEATY